MEIFSSNKQKENKWIHSCQMVFIFMLDCVIIIYKMKWNECILVCYVVDSIPFALHKQQKCNTIYGKKEGEWY